MHHDVFGNALNVYLEVVKLHHTIRAEIAVTNLVLWTIDTGDLAADHRRDFQVPHFQRSPREKELKEPLQADSA
jgi:hypothetical protein